MNSDTMLGWMTRTCRTKIVTTQVFRLKAENYLARHDQTIQHLLGFYDLGFKQRCILVGQEARPLNVFSLARIYP